MNEPNARPSTTAQELFDELAADHLDKPGVSLGRIWHSQGLTVNGKILAMVVRGRLVVKLPAPQAAALIATEEAVALEPRPGRRMKEWVAVELRAPAADRSRWRQLMADAYSYGASPASQEKARKKAER